MLQLTAELNTWRVVFVSKGFCLFVWLNHIIMLHPSNLKWAKHLRFFIPHFFRKISAGDEIQLLIGDLFQFPSIFCVMLSCFVHQKIQIKHLNSLSSSVALALCPFGPMVGPKRNLRAFFDLGNFGWEFGCWKPPNKHLFKLQKQDKQAKFFWPEKKRGWFFGRWENQLKLDCLILVPVSCWKTSSSLMDENANGLKFFLL